MMSQSEGRCCANTPGFAPNFPENHVLENEGGDLGADRPDRNEPGPNRKIGIDRDGAVGEASA
jgi:hypothetical protein